MRASDGSLERMLRRDLGVSRDYPIFIPVKRSALAEKQVVVSAMDGYVFVGAGMLPGRYFSLEKRSYVEQVLCRQAGSHRIPHIIRDSELGPLRGQIEKVEKSSSVRRGAKVEVSSGMLASLQGTVVDLTDNSACVRFDTRTLVRIISLPLVMLKAVAEEAAPKQPVPAPKLRQGVLFAQGRAVPARDHGPLRLRARLPRSIPRVQLGFNF